MSQTTKKVKLTRSQIALLINLLYDHRQDGSYWGVKKQHYELIEKTLETLDPEREYAW